MDAVDCRSTERNPYNRESDEECLNAFRLLHTVTSLVEAFDEDFRIPTPSYGIRSLQGFLLVASGIISSPKDVAWPLFIGLVAKRRLGGFLEEIGSRQQPCLEEAETAPRLPASHSSGIVVAVK